jgi:predicted ATPase
MPESLVGRDAELAAVRALLAEGTVVTLTGVGGVGKTALALAAAPGAAVCELAAVGSPGAVAAAVADPLGFPSLDAAAVGLAEAERLVVLDNCEHVLDAAADVVERLTGACPGLTVLATSREPLDVPGEQVLRLAPLGLPAGDEPGELRASSAVALLLARARAAGVDIGLDAATAPAVAALCRRLDGLPLAIELAAARIRSLTPAEILAHLEDRLDLLTRPRRRGPARHRSLEAAIGWSHDRLPEDTRRFFDRLGVFAGRFSAEAALAVAGEPGDGPVDAADRLDQLVAQSLLTVRSQDGRSWYGLLETLRAFARGQLADRGELAAVRDRWVDAMIELARESMRYGTGTPAPDPWATIHAAQADLHEAARHCVRHDERADRAVALLRPLWVTAHSGSAERVTALGDSVLARWPNRGSPDWATAAAVTASAHLARGDDEAAAELARSALAVADDPVIAWMVRRTLLVCELSAGRAGQALRWADEAVAAARELPGAAAEVGALRAVVLAALGRGEAAAAHARATEADAAALGAATLQAWAGLVAASLLALRDPAAARVAMEDLVRRCQDAAYPLGEGVAGRALGAIALVRGEYGAAAEWLGRSLDVFVRIGHTVQLRVGLRWVAGLAAAAGRPAALPLQEAAGMVRTPLSEVLEWAWLDPLLGSSEDPVVALPLREALALARRELAELAAGAPAAADEPVPERFVLEGAAWAVAYAGRTVQVPDSKGMRDLAVLLSRPGREVHCTELAGAAVEQPDTGEVLDAQARRRYEARIVELQAELTEAEELGDRGRAEKAGLELDLLVEQLTAARGLGGRARRAGGTAERARTAVTWRIRTALRRIDEANPQLGRHLKAAVRTGLWCSYAPEQPVGWQLRAPTPAP